MEDYKIQRSIRQRFQALGSEKDGLARQVKILPLGPTLKHESQQLNMVRNHHNACFLRLDVVRSEAQYALSIW